ncbi:hypothetical protein LIA77_08549 [Sarocladium implicatum]|nr:hypothetical protein LIA77_08549 [Sarocladium implicatum]
MGEPSMTITHSVRARMPQRPVSRSMMSVSVPWEMFPTVARWSRLVSSWCLANGDTSSETETVEEIRLESRQDRRGQKDPRKSAGDAERSVPKSQEMVLVVPKLRTRTRVAWNLVMKECVSEGQKLTKGREKASSFTLARATTTTSPW